MSPAFLARQWKPGQSGNPSGHTAEFGEIVRLARQLSVRAVERLGELMESEDERVAAVAANGILDRAYGRPQVRQPEPTDHIVERLRRMTDAQRLAEAKALLDKANKKLDEADRMGGAPLIDGE